MSASLEIDNASKKETGLLTSAFNVVTAPVRFVYNHPYISAAFAALLIGLSLKFCVPGLGGEWGWKGSAAAATAALPVAAKTAQALEVLLDGSDYYIRNLGDAAWTHTNLDTIKNMAKKLPGTSDGVKIFLQPTKDALIGTKADLYSALSGIVNPHDIVTRTQFIPSPFPH